MVSSKDLKYNVNQADLHCNIPKHLPINYVDMNIMMVFDMTRPGCQPTTYHTSITKQPDAVM